MKLKPNFDILESLRGVAALYVCIGHARANLWIGGEHYLKIHPKETLAFTDYLLLGLNMLSRLTSEFVIVFFVLSGFSIAHSLRKNTNPVSFYKRRFIRLYPSYITAIFWAMAVILIINAISPGFTDGSYHTATFDRIKDSWKLFEWDVFFKNLVYLPQLDGVLRPFWSLTMEVIFYLLAPYLFRNKIGYYSASIAAFAVWVLSQFTNWHIQPIISEFLFYNLFFAIGVALYNHYDQVTGKFRLLTTPKALWLALGLFFSMIGISLVITRFEPFTAFLAAAMSVALIIYLLSNNKEIKWLVGIGRFSYTLYITHFPTVMLYLVLVFTLTNSQPPYIYNNLVFIPCVALCLGIAYVQYYFVERKSKQVLDVMRNKSLARSEEPVQQHTIVDQGNE